MNKNCLIVVISLILMAGCEQTAINRGYDVGTADFSSIIVGSDTADSVWKKLGSPTGRSSVLSENGEYSWFYASKQMKKIGVLNPKTVRTVTYVITFDAKDIVKSVETKNHEIDISRERDTVNTQSGKNKGFIKETFGGVGKYISMYDK